VASDGTERGLDSRGEYNDTTLWRHFGVGAEGAEYYHASKRDAGFFDNIIETACLVPYPSENRR
jgi:hypothetical protein